MDAFGLQLCEGLFAQAVQVSEDDGRRDGGGRGLMFYEKPVRDYCVSRIWEVVLVPKYVKRRLPWSVV